MPAASRTVILFGLMVCSLPAQDFIEPRPYWSFANPAAGDAISPFSGLEFTYFHLEDFEDGLLSTPGVSLDEGGNPNGPAPVWSDSVDDDDGVLDGLATETASLFSNFSTSSFTFRFSAQVLGALPSHAGIVWTDVGQNFGGAPLPADRVDNVIFEAFGPDGSSLGVIGPYSLGDDTISRTTEEDRFLGVQFAGGISAIRISMPGKNNWEVDHLQYGLACPPPTLVLSKGAAGALRIDFTGVLEASPGLGAPAWEPLLPPPSSPYVFHPAADAPWMFFRATKP
jgi:hypothetical protein